MHTRRFTRGTAVVAAVAGMALTFGSGPANADPTQDTAFLALVQQLNIPLPNPDDAITVAQQICKTVADGRVEPAPTVRGIRSKLVSEGLSKDQATQLIWGAVGIYCPEYRPLVGR